MAPTNNFSDLPLGWTQIKRRQRTTNTNMTSVSDKNGNSVTDDDWCCDDPSCTPANRTFRSNDTVLSGQAILCLHEIDSLWFQGQFLVREELDAEAMIKPMGLLFEQKEVDPCLQCADGGFRKLHMTLYKKPKAVDISDIDWTGGDMMKLAGERVVFDTDRLVTGTKAIPLVQKYFPGLIRRLQDGDVSGQVLDLIPDVAIVVGEMKISFSKKEV